MKILLVEDDRTTADYIAEGLRQEGHTVDTIEEGRDGLVRATTGEYDVMIVDRMLPGLDGLSLVKTLRAARNLTPVLFLTSLGGVDDRIEGLT
ncbi:response regulator, partial [Thioclava sp. BHET1]